MVKKATAVVFLLGACLFLVGHKQGGGEIISLPYETQGEKHWFVTPTGTGDCTSWDDACKFRDAVLKCADDRHDVLWLGEGEHDTDNGVDGNGTLIDKSGVGIVGLGNGWAGNARFVNSHASAAIVLRVGAVRGLTLHNMNFDNTGKTDENVIYLKISGATAGAITECRFRQESGAGGGTGILFDGNSDEFLLGNLDFSGIVDVGIKTNGMKNLLADRVHIVKGGTGIEFAGGANDEHLDFFDFKSHSLTTAVIIGASVDLVTFCEPCFIHNTTDIVDNGVFDGLHIFNAKYSHHEVKMYPAPTPGGPTSLGVACSSGDGIDTWGAACNLIPASTIGVPFTVTHLYAITATPTNTFRVKLYYGESTADTAVGEYQFIVGANIGIIQIPIFQPYVKDGSIPSNAGLWAKVLSDTDGVDSVTLSVGYF